MVRGVEISLQSDNTRMVSAELSYTYLDAVYTKHNPFKQFDDYTTRTAYSVYNINGNEIPRVSKHTADLFINYKPTADIKIVTELFARSDYWADERNKLKMDGYELVNLQARYYIQSGENELELYAKVDNLLDDQYYRAAFVHSDKRAPIGVDKDDISITVDPGRVYYAGVKYRF